MGWVDLLAFLRMRDPAYLDTVKGVPREEISLCEEGCKISLPSLYVDFLMKMGASSGTFHPFGVTQVCNFYELVEQLPAEDYPGDRYFKVAFETDPSLVASYDAFLDLARSNGQDAPLVQFEDGGGFAPEYVVEVGFTLEEWLTRRIFSHFDVNRRAEHRNLWWFCESPADGRRKLEAAINLLDKMGLVPVLPPLPRVMCLWRDTLSALLEVSGSTGSISIALGTDEGHILRVAVEQVLDGLPGAKTNP